jgi:hypothetical protein
MFAHLNGWRLSCTVGPCGEAQQTFRGIWLARRSCGILLLTQTYFVDLDYEKLACLILDFRPFFRFAVGLEEARILDRIEKQIAVQSGKLGRQFLVILGVWPVPFRCHNSVGYD